jgi:hypothetical protein
MYITKLKDGPKRVKTTFSMILERVFEVVWWKGRKWNHIKIFFEVVVFLSSQNIDFPFFEETLGAFLFIFPFSSFSIFFLFSVSRGLGGFWWYLRRKSLLQKPLFKWHDMELPRTVRIPNVMTWNSPELSESTERRSKPVSPNPYSPH